MVVALELTNYTLYFPKIFQELSASRNGHLNQISIFLINKRMKLETRNLQNKC
jgi:hypothetical protein